MSDYLEIARKVMSERQAESLEAVLQGRAIELWWSEDNQSLFIVADEEDARRLGEPRGSVYTADEVRRVIIINDPVTVQKIHAWKRRFNAILVSATLEEGTSDKPGRHSRMRRDRHIETQAFHARQIETAETATREGIQNQMPGFLTAGEQQSFR